MYILQALLDGIDPTNPSDADYTNAEKFMVRLYNSNKDTLDQARVTTLLTSDKPEDSPPTSNAAKYHIRRAFCQAAKLIHASQNWHANLPSPVSSGGFMEVEGRLVPVMTTIEQMPAKLLDILICKCATSCDTKKCKCQTAGMGCTLLCHKKYNHNNCKNKYNSNSGL